MSGLVEKTNTLIRALAKQVLNVRAPRHYLQTGPGTPDGWPGPAKPGLTEAQRARRPSPQTLPRAVPMKLHHAKTGRSFLKRWGSTDKTKRRHGRLACLTGVSS